MNPRGRTKKSNASRESGHGKNTAEKRKEKRVQVKKKQCGKKKRLGGRKGKGTPMEREEGSGARTRRSISETPKGRNP